MKILSWNVNGRVQGACQRQLERVLSRAPDVLALQEVTNSSYSSWCDGLQRTGYSVVSAIDLARLPYPGVGKVMTRRYFNLIAVRGRMVLLPGLRFDDPEEARL